MIEHEHHLHWKQKSLQHVTKSRFLDEKFEDMKKLKLRILSLTF